MYTPTPADLEARERARQQGRAAAAAAQVHAPTAADQPPADAAPLATHMELLRLDPEAGTADVTPAGGAVEAIRAESAAVPAPAPAPQPAPAHTMKPLPGGLPTAVWLLKLAAFHGAARVSPRSSEGELPADHHRVTWTANDAEASADFTTATAARLFIVDAADEGVATQLWHAITPNAAPAPDSAPPVADDAPAGTTGAENTEGPSTGRKTAFTTYGLFEAIGPASDLAQAFGAYQAGDAFKAPPRAELDEGAVRVTWKADNLPVATFADFATFDEADVFADMLLDEDLTSDVRLSGSGDAPDGKRSSSPLRAFLGLDMDKLFRQALVAELKRTTRQLAVVRWWAIAGWLAALCFGAAAVAMAVALRGFLA